MRRNSMATCRSRPVLDRAFVMPNLHTMHGGRHGDLNTVRRLGYGNPMPRGLALHGCGTSDSGDGECDDEQGNAESTVKDG
jgi:hypothetical protein